MVEKMATEVRTIGELQAVWKFGFWNFAHGVFFLLLMVVGMFIFAFAFTFGKNFIQGKHGQYDCSHAHHQFGVGELMRKLVHVIIGGKRCVYIRILLLVFLVSAVVHDGFRF
jgi:hypothetical protein